MFFSFKSKIQKYSIMIEISKIQNCVLNVKLTRSASWGKVTLHRYRIWQKDHKPKKKLWLLRGTHFENPHLKILSTSLEKRFYWLFVAKNGVLGWVCTAEEFSSQRKYDWLRRKINIVAFWDRRRTREEKQAFNPIPKPYNTFLCYLERYPIQNSFNHSNLSRVLQASSSIFAMNHKGEKQEVTWL